MHGVLIWKEFQTAVNLNTIVRQGEQEQQFRDVLLSMRTYSTTVPQAVWLQNFQWSNLSAKYGSLSMKNLNENGLFVFPTHNEVWQHNKNKYSF
jgi:hypothetical protein